MENISGNPTMMKKRLKMKSKAEKKSKIKPPEATTVMEEEEAVVVPAIQSPPLDVESNLPLVEETIEE